MRKIRNIRLISDTHLLVITPAPADPDTHLLVVMLAPADPVTHLLVVMLAPVDPVAGAGQPVVIEGARRGQDPPLPVVQGTRGVVGPHRVGQVDQAVAVRL